MCGIVGYVGRGHEAGQVILDGLRRLETRGYDSAGVAILEGDRLHPTRNGQARQPRGAPARAAAQSAGSASATPAGRPTASPPSATPTRTRGGVVIVHNGIMENYRELRAALEAGGP